MLGLKICVYCFVHFKLTSYTRPLANFLTVVTYGVILFVQVCQTLVKFGTISSPEATVSKSCSAKTACEELAGKNARFCTNGPEPNCTFCCEGPFCNFKPPVPTLSTYNNVQPERTRTLSCLSAPSVSSRTIQT